MSFAEVYNSFKDLMESNGNWKDLIEGKWDLEKTQYEFITNNIRVYLNIAIAVRLI